MRRKGRGTAVTSSTIVLCFIPADPLSQTLPSSSSPTSTLTSLPSLASSSSTSCRCSCSLLLHLIPLHVPSALDPTCCIPASSLTDHHPQQHVNSDDDEKCMKKRKRSNSSCSSSPVETSIETSIETPVETSASSSLASMRPSDRMDRHTIELNGTIWKVPTCYTDLTTIGRGAYGQVCSAVVSSGTSVSSSPGQKLRRVAIKKIKDPLQTETHAKRTCRELKLLKQIVHDNVIGLLDVFTSASTPSEMNDVYFVTHLMEQDLNQTIKTQTLSPDQIKFLTYQILRGLKYIHSAGIIHRDLKPSNLAVTSNCELRILDFGLARHADSEMTGYVATRYDLFFVLPFLF